MRLVIVIIAAIAACFAAVLLLHTAFEAIPGPTQEITR
jgi:hypothetical protein